MSFKIDINEKQRSLLIDFVCDSEITEWVEKGRKVANGKYRISVDDDQLDEMISALFYLSDKGEYKWTKKELVQLADYLEEQMMNEY